MNEREILAEAERAEALLNDPLIKKVLNGMREKLRGAVDKEKTFDPLYAERLFNALKVVDSFESALFASIQSGKVVEIDIKRKRKIF